MAFILFACADYSTPQTSITFVHVTCGVNLIGPVWDGYSGEVVMYVLESIMVKRMSMTKTVVRRMSIMMMCKGDGKSDFVHDG